MMPVRGYGISTPYRKTGSWWKMCGWHTGVDFAAPLGTPIYAPVPGTIRWRAYGTCWGKRQFVISPDPGSTGDPLIDNGEILFAHTLDRLADGTNVKAGQLIARVGNEGCSSGPHLHMQLHTRKQQCTCSVFYNPQRVLDWQPSGTKPPPSSGWKYPAGTKVYAKYLRWKGHEQNADGKSTSIGAWQDMLNRHSLQGGTTLPVTEAWHSMTAAETQKCQTQHVPPADQPLEAVFVGPKQFEHVKAATKAPYEWVGDTVAPPPVTPPPPPPTVSKPAPPSLMYPNAIWDPIEKSGGGWFEGLREFSGSARKITLHTTETSVKPNWKQQQSGIPHFTMSLSSGSVWQHLRLDRAAYTLKGGANSPNSASGLNIQIEVIGFTREAPTWPDGEYLRLRLMLEWLGANLGIPVVAPLPFDKPQRLTWEQWAPLSGVVLHAHVPYNDHSDITGLDVDRLLGGTSPEPPERPVEPPESGDYISRADFDEWRQGVASALLEDW